MGRALCGRPAHPWRAGELRTARRRPVAANLSRHARDRRGEGSGLDREPVRLRGSAHGNGGERRQVHRHLGRAGRQLHAGAAGRLRGERQLRAGAAVARGWPVARHHAEICGRRVAVVAVAGRLAEAGALRRRPGRCAAAGRRRGPQWRRRLLLPISRERPELADVRSEQAGGLRPVPARLQLRRRRGRHVRRDRRRERVGVLDRRRAEVCLSRRRQVLWCEPRREPLERLSARRLGHGDGGLARCAGGADVRVRRAAGKNRSSPPASAGTAGIGKARRISSNKLTVHDGANGKIVAEVPLARALGLAVSGDVLYALQAEDSGFVVSSAAIVQGVPGGVAARLHRAREHHARGPRSRQPRAVLSQRFRGEQSLPTRRPGRTSRAPSAACRRSSPAATIRRP